MVTEDIVLEAQRRAEQLPTTITQLRNFFGVTDGALADVLHVSRSTVHNKLKATNGTPITAQELLALSAFFEVPVEVLTNGTRAAMQWVIDHPEAGPRSRRVLAA